MGFKVYTAGKMGGLSQEEAMSWRTSLEHLIRVNIELTHPKGVDVTFIHPPLYYSYEEQREKSAREMILWEINQIYQSDVVAVNLTGVLTSVGTLMELGAIQAINQSTAKYISVIGIGGECAYPWVNEVLLRREDTIEDAARYIAEYNLV